MKILYSIPISEASQTDERDRLGSELAEAGVLNDSAVVEQLSSEAPDLRLDGQFRVGEYFAELLAEELEELANSQYAELPLYRQDGRYPEAGFYEIQTADVEPAHANTRSTYVWSLDLKKQGTRNDYYRVLEPSPRQAEHEFGNDLDVLVALPAAASKVQWYDDSGEREPAEPTETRESEYGEIDIYNLEDAPEYDPEPYDEDVPRLLYDIDYEDDTLADCAVYDTRGHEEKYLENADGRVRVWEHVYSTSHDPDDAVVLDNGLLRLRIDEDAATLEAEEYDDGWEPVTLEQPTDIEVYDIDITEIGMVRDTVQLTFDVDGSLFALDVILHAGWESVQCDLPEGETGPIPESVEEWLAPIASETLIDPNAGKTLVSRSEVRR